MATGDKLVTLDGMKALKDALYVEPAVFEVPSGQWQGSGSDWYFTVSASNVTTDSILIPTFDSASSSLFTGTKLWCVPDSGSFTVHVDAVPAGTVTIMVQFPGTMGTAQYSVLPDAYTTDQVDDMFDNVYMKSEVYTKTETNSAISQSTASVNVTDKFTIASKYAGYIFQAYRTGKTVVITIVSENISAADDDVVVTLNDLSLRPVGASARAVAAVRVGTSVGMLFYIGDSNTFRLWISNAATGRLMTQIVYLIA